jgi:hypothetical protein
MSGLHSVTARRAWFVPDFSVWGQPSLGEQEYLGLEKVDDTWSVYYGTVSIGQSIQEVAFDQLTDHRGNQLPGSINAPRVFVRPKSSQAAFVIGQESADRFKIAREAEADGPVSVDLWIIEVGD